MKASLAYANSPCKTVFMRDRTFFLLVAFLLIAMTWIALAPGIGALPTGAVTGDGRDYSVITIEDSYLNKVYAGGDAITRLQKDSSGSRELYVEAEANHLSDSPELGPHFKLAGDIETQFSGMKIRVTIQARPSSTRGAEQIAINYSAGRAGESGWRVFDLQPQSSTVSFDYNVPLALGEQGNDYLGLRPVVPTKSRAVIVEKVTFERLERWAEPIE